MARLSTHMWPSEVLAERSWEPGEGLSAFDAAYVASQNRLDALLATAHSRLARAPGPTCLIELYAKPG